MRYSHIITSLQIRVRGACLIHVYQNIFRIFQNFTPGTKIEDVNGKDVDTDLLLYETLKFVVEQIMSTNGFKHAEIGIQDVDFVIVLPITCNNEVTRFVETIALKVRLVYL